MASSNRQRILPVGPAPARLFFSFSLRSSSTETPKARFEFIERERALRNPERLGQSRL
jgi:hypothetical protein